MVRRGLRLPFELTRTSSGWTVVRDAQRRLWRGGIHYSAVAGEGFLWQGKLRLLLRPDEPGVGVDGYLSPAELADTGTCLGRSLIVDGQYRPQDAPSLPEDHCVDKVTAVAGTLFILGRDAQGRLVLERIVGSNSSSSDTATGVASASVRFALPRAGEGCSLFGSDVAMDVEATDRLFLAGSYHCTNENSTSDSEFELLFDGAGLVPATIEWPAELPPEESSLPATRLRAQKLARELNNGQRSFIILGEQLHERSRGTWVPITLPRDESDEAFFGPTLPLEIIEASDGTVWVMAGADGGGCVTAGRWQPRLLYSTVSSTNADPAPPQPRSDCARRMLEAENCHSLPAMIVLATLDLERGFRL